MGIGSSNPERADASAKRLVAGHRNGRGIYIERRLGKIDERIRGGEMERRGNDTMLQGESRLYKPGDPGCSVKVTDVALQRTQGGCVSALSSRTEGTCQSREFDWIAYFGSCSMS